MADESLRDTLASAFDASEAPPAPASEAPPVETPPSVTESAPEAPSTVETPGERARDAYGRFAPQPKRDLLAAPPADALKPAVPTDAHPAPGQPEAPKPPEPIKAPVSWKPELRAKFALLPPDVQAEVLRREGEIPTRLAQLERERSEGTTAKTALGELQKVVAPFYQNIQAAHNGNVVGAIQLLLATDNRLRHGSTGEKAQVVVDIIRNYGIDITALDSALAGSPQPDDPAEVAARRLRAEIDQRMQPVMNLFQQYQQREQEQLAEVQRSVYTELESFASTHEHYETVKMQMANWLEVAKRDGLTLSLQDAYDRAIMLNPTLAAEVADRKEKERVAAAVEAAQRAKRAATSLPSGGAPSGSPPGSNAQDNRRASIEAAFAAHENR